MNTQVLLCEMIVTARRLQRLLYAAPRALLNLWALLLTWLVFSLKLASKTILYAIPVVLVSLLLVSLAKRDSSTITIREFTQPTVLLESGYGPTSTALRLRDMINQICGDSYHNTSKERAFEAPRPIGSYAFKASGVEFSLETLEDAIGQLLVWRPSIGGLIVCMGDSCALTVTLGISRDSSKSLKYYGPTRGIDSLLRSAAIEIVCEYNPYAGASYLELQGDYNEALECIVSKGLSRGTRRDSAYSYYLWGQILDDLKQWGPASRMYGKAIAVDQNFFPAYLAKVNCESDRKDSTLAKQWGRTLMRQFPDSELSYLTYYARLRDWGQHDSALAIARAGVLRLPYSSLARYGLGCALIYMDSNVAAENELRRALEIDFDNVFARENLALLRFNAKDTLEAEENWLISNASDSLSDIDSWYLGKIWFDRRNFEMARFYFANAAKRVFPTRVPYRGKLFWMELADSSVNWDAYDYIWLGRTYDSMHDTTQARNCYLTARKLDPKGVIGDSASIALKQIGSE